MKHLTHTLFIVAFLIPARAMAQAPINAPGAMQPSTHTGVFSETIYYRELGADPNSAATGANETIFLTQIAYGLSHNLSFQFDAPIVHRDLQFSSASDDEDLNVGDMSLLFKWRLYQHDPKPTNTSRFSVIGGLQVPGNEGLSFDSSRDSWNPIVGAVYSIVHERHGFNASTTFEYDTKNAATTADTLRYDLSYLYRLVPDEYTSETVGAWYGLCELNGFYETNGDNQVFISPGIMYEGRSTTLTATLLIPTWQELDHRAETDFMFGFGVRLSF